MTQQHLAKILDVHRPAVAEIEAGRRRLTLDEAVTLTIVFKTDLDAFDGTPLIGSPR